MLEGTNCNGTPVDSLISFIIHVIEVSAFLSGGGGGGPRAGRGRRRGGGRSVSVGVEGE